MFDRSISQRMANTPRSVRNKGCSTVTWLFLLTEQHNIPHPIVWLDSQREEWNQSCFGLRWRIFTAHIFLRICGYFSLWPFQCQHSFPGKGGRTFLPGRKAGSARSNSEFGPLKKVCLLHQAIAVEMFYFQWTFSGYFCLKE